MLQSTKQVLGKALVTRDGKRAQVGDLIVDDRDWTVRHLLVSWGWWPLRRKRLVAPEAVAETVGSGSRGLSLSAEELKHCPKVHEQPPVAYRLKLEKQMERMGLDEAMSSAPEAAEADERDAEDHRRSVRELEGYQVKASDSPVGRVMGFLVDEGRWALRYALLEADDAGRIRRPVPVELARDIDCAGKCVNLQADTERLRTAPSWAGQEALTSEQEAEVQAHFRPDGDAPDGAAPPDTSSQ